VRKNHSGETSFGSREGGKILGVSAVVRSKKKGKLSDPKVPDDGAPYFTYRKKGGRISYRDPKKASGSCKKRLAIKGGTDLLAVSGEAGNEKRSTSQTSTFR